MSRKKVHLIIRGYVQGVFYRASARNTALNLGLKGWVRNLLDGSVEAVFEGDEEDIKKAIQWCYNGPNGARVTEIDEKWFEFKGEYKDFDIIY